MGVNVDEDTIHFLSAVFHEIHQREAENPKKTSRESLFLLKTSESMKEIKELY